MEDEDTPPIFDHRMETSSQESILRRCGYGLQRGHLDSQFSAGSPPEHQKNERISPADVPGPSGKMENESYRPGAEDPVVHVVSEEQTIVAEIVGENQVLREEDGPRVLEKPVDVSDQPLFSGDSNDGCLESQVKENRRTKLKIPLREVVKAIVMNTRDERNIKEKEEIEKMDFVQILMSKGFKIEKPVDVSDQPLSSGNLNDGCLESQVKENRRAKLKIPLREVVKAIVMNTRDERNIKEKEEIEKIEFVQILMSKGFKFPEGR